MENPTHGIKSWAENDRPREKLIRSGRHVLSDAELVAILLGSGSRTETALDLARKVLQCSNNDLNQLAKMLLPELTRIRGIGEAKAVSIIAALELGRRRKETAVPLRPRIQCSRDIFEHLKARFMDLPHEEFRILLLNRANVIIREEFISRGGVSGTVVDARLIFKPALECLACSVILCHNHPSGNLKPSDADLGLTRKLREAGRLMEIDILDHIIFGENSYFSFADEGLL